MLGAILEVVLTLVEPVLEAYRRVRSDEESDGSDESNEGAHRLP